MLSRPSRLPALLTLPMLASLVLPASALAFDHARFDELLGRHVLHGAVDYDAFAVSPEFGSYLSALAGFDPTALPGQDRLAFWINAYNAYTIHLVNVHGERDSIRNIEAGVERLEVKGPWSAPVAKIGGRVYSLDQIEHEILRERFDEPRIHFALVCAAASCPPLRSEAYVGDRLDSQLDDQARTFLTRSPEKNRVDVAEGVLYASPIFDWFREDFGGTDEAIGRFVAAYYPEGPERRLLTSGDFALSKTSYDWTLNARGRMRTPAYQVFAGMLRFADSGEGDKVRRSLELLGPVLEHHLDAVSSEQRQVVTELLSSQDRASLVEGVRRLIARDILVLLDEVTTAPPGQATTSIRAAELEWGLLAPEGEDSEVVGATLARVREAVETGQDRDRLATLVADAQGKLSARFN